jgi:phenylalanyl-tRNA synthetase alpha subunit
MSSQVSSILDNIIDQGTQLTDQAIHKAQELGNIAKDHIEDISVKVTSNEHVQDVLTKANEIKENVEDKVHNLADKAMENEHVASIVHNTEEVKNTVTDKIEDTIETVKDKFDNSEYTPETIDIDAANAILGKTVGDITILNTNEEVLAFPGEVVTQELIESARNHKVLDVLMANVE